jgi:hypothetical protein
MTSAEYLISLKLRFESERAMTKLKRPLRAALAVCMAMGVLAPMQARAGTVLGVDVANYIILYEGGGTGHHLNINNFGIPTSRVWDGDIGIAGHGLLGATGPGTLNGNINFAASDTGQATINNTTINGTVSYGVISVQTIMNNLNTLSSTLGALHASGTGLAINTGSTNQTVLATNGANEIINSVSYRLFNVTSVSTNNGKDLIIKGDGSQSVVLDVGISNPQFNSNILLEDLNGKFYGDTGYAGLTPDQLLINLYGGSNLSGGPTLQVNNQGDGAHPNNFIYGTFLDPNGSISMVNTRFVGRDFGGDSHDMQIVSGDTTKLPVEQNNQQPIPEPGALVIWSAFGLIVAGARWRKRK